MNEFEWWIQLMIAIKYEATLQNGIEDMEKESSLVGEIIRAEVELYGEGYRSGFVLGVICGEISGMEKMFEGIDCELERRGFRNPVIMEGR